MSSPFKAILFLLILGLLQSHSSDLQAQAQEAGGPNSPFYAKTPVFRPSLGTLSYSNRYNLKWIPNTEQYVQLGYKTDNKTDSRAFEIKLHDRLGHTLNSCLIEQNINRDTYIFDFAVMPTGKSLTIGFHESEGPDGDVNLLQSYALPEMKLQWEKQLPEDEEFQVISPYGILTSNDGEKAVYDPATGSKLCDIPKELITGYFSDASKYGYVNFTPNKCLVYIEGVSSLDDAAETPEGITLYRFQLENEKATSTSLKLETPRRKRAYSEYAVRYDSQTDTLHLGSRTGVIDIFDASTGKLTRSVKLQAPDENHQLPIPLPTTLTERPLVLWVRSSGSGVLCSVDGNNEPVPLVRDENTEIYGLHPTLPLAFFGSNCLHNIGILDYHTSTIDGAILAFQLEGNGIDRISANDDTIWTHADIYGSSISNACEVSEWSLSSGEKLEGFQISSATQEGGFAAKAGRCFLTSEYEGVELNTKTGVTKHSWDGNRVKDAYSDDTSFYFIREQRDGFDLMSAQGGKTSVVTRFPRFGLRSEGCALASDQGRFAMAGGARLSTRGSMIGDDRFLLLFDRNANSQREVKMDVSNFKNMAWIGERLVVARHNGVAWYDEPFKESSEEKKDDGQIPGRVGSIHKLGDELVVVSENQQGLVISVCGWDEEGLFVKRDRKILISRTSSLIDNQDKQAVAAGCFFYATDRYVIATRIDD